MNDEFKKYIKYLENFIEEKLKIDILTNDFTKMLSDLNQ